MSAKNEFKIIIIGNSKTGKTSYSNKWSENSFSENYQPTYFGENKTKEIEIDKKPYTISLFDFLVKIIFHPHLQICWEKILMDVLSFRMH